jgi:predicted nucleotidyltransferase component of viral defense system
VKDRKVKNIAASVRQRLLNVAQASGRPFQEVLQYYAMERFLYRLAQSPYADRFVLKGALMFNAWRAPTSRPTKDIDLLGRMENTPGDLAAAMRDVCRQTVEDDGLVFDHESVDGTVIKEDADYEGVRVTFPGSLENARIAMQIDIGFGDVMFPGPELTDYPTILDHAAPRLRGYARETAVAEKFEAMVKFGLLNSRMKDFYDIWLLSRQFDFDGTKLATAIEKTFANRGTAVEEHPASFSPAFASDPTKATQWQAFVRKSRLADEPSELASVVASIATFLSPPAAAIRGGKPFEHVWRAPGPWHSPLA